jgi:transcriptional regulator with XRE-family HTH domain
LLAFVRIFVIIKSLHGFFLRLVEERVILELNIIKELRAESGLTLRELAKESGMGQDTISQLENDRQKAQLLTLSKLAKTFTRLLGRHVSVELFTGLMDTTASDRGKKGGTPSHQSRAGGGLAYAEGAAIIINGVPARPLVEPEHEALAVKPESGEAGQAQAKKKRAAPPPARQFTTADKANAGRLAREFDLNFGQAKNTMLALPDFKIPYEDLHAAFEAKYKRKGKESGS